MDNIFTIYTPPFNYDDHGQKVFDSFGHMAVDIRGWGLFQYEKNGAELQCQFGQWVTDALNEKYKRDGL